MDGRAGGRQSGSSGQGRWQKRRGSGGEGDEEYETESRFGQMSWGSLVVFLGIYVALRFVTKLTTAITTRGDGAVVEANSASSNGSPFVTAMLTGGTAAL